MMLIRDDILYPLMLTSNGTYRANPLSIYLDDKFVGDVCDMNSAPRKARQRMFLSIFLRAAIQLNGICPFEGFGGSTGFNIVDVKFTRIGNISMKNCSEVGLYGYNYPDRPEWGLRSKYLRS